MEPKEFKIRTEFSNSENKFVEISFELLMSIKTGNILFIRLPKDNELDDDAELETLELDHDGSGLTEDDIADTYIIEAEYYFEEFKTLFEKINEAKQKFIKE